MSDEQNNKLALIKREPDYIDGEIVHESFIARKRAELRRALEAGTVQDPTGGLIIAGLISLGVSLAGSAISSIFAPKPKPIEKGRTTGQLVISSQLGVLIPEAYFGDPGDGLGGTWLPAIVISLSPIVKQVNVSRQSTGGGKGGGGQTQEVREIVYFFPYIACMYGRGPLRALKLRNNSDIVFDLYGQVSKYEGESGTLAGSTAIDINEDASGGQNVALNPAASVQWSTVQSNGAATRQTSIRYRTATSTAVSAELTVNGVMQVISFPGSSGNFRAYTIALSLIDGPNVIKVKNTHGSLVLAIDYLYCFPGHTSADASTGVLDSTVAVDSVYDQFEPPDPTAGYTRPLSRFNGAPDMDEYATQTGTIMHGGNAQFAIYEGNYTQLPDPTMQASIDALYGADSTPAYRGRAYEVDSNLYLTRWGNAIPNKTGLFENNVIKTLAQFCADRCSRVSIVTADYDFVEFDGILPRGLRMIGQRYEAKDHMTQAETLFNIFFTEEDFQIKGKVIGASVATLTDEDFGWIEGDELPESLSSVDIPEQDATRLPARVEIKYLDLDRDGDPGLQGYGRHETIGIETETLDFSDWTLTADEAQAVAQRVTYQRYIEKPLRFVLSWKYVWLTAGDVITANLDSGYSYEIQIDKISGGIGIQECEGHLIDTPIYTQPVTTGTGDFGVPVVPLPAMTILALLDLPPRDKDETENMGIGTHGAMTPRTNSGQVWTGASLYVDKVGWERIADFNLPATIGVITDFDINTTDTSGFDYDGWIEIDFYHTDQFTPELESVSEADVLNGANLMAINTPDGELLIQFATKELISPNKYRISDLLYGRRGTEHLLSGIAVDRRAVLLNEAVQFIPMNVSDLNQTLDYRAVSFGQSLDDAATVEYTWTGKSKQPLSTINHRGTRDSAQSLLIELELRSRVGGGLRSYQAGAVNEETEEARVQILDGSGNTTLPNGKVRIMKVYVGTPMAALLESDSSTGKFGYIAANSLVLPASAAVNVNAVSAQTIEQTGNSCEATLTLGAGNGERAGFGILPANFNWRGASLSQIQTAAHIWILYEATVPPAVTVYEYGVNKYALNSPGDSRYRIAFVGSEIRVYRNWTGSSGELIYSSPKEQTYPYRLIMRTETDESSVSKVTMTTRPFPKTIYSAGQQIEDGFTPGDPVQMDIWQVSRIVGDGVKTRITL